MGEEDVKIPISLEVDKKELQELKADIDKTFSRVKDYEKSWSTKKEPFKLGDVAKTEASIQSIISKIASLQNEFDIVSKSSPAAKLLDIQKEIGDTIRANTADLKDQQSAQVKLAVYSREQKKYLNEANNIQKDIAKLQEDYIAARAKVDTTKKGSKSEFKDLEKQYTAEMDALDERLRAAKTSETVYRTQANQARQEVESIKNARAERANSLAELRSQASEIGKLVKSEDYVKQKEIERVNALKRINAELKTQRDLLLEAQNSAENQLAADMERTGKRTGRPSRHDKAIETAERNAQRQEDARLRVRERVLLEEQKIRRALAAEEVKANDANVKAQIKSLNKEMSAVKQSAAQYYYKLRAIKMLGFVFNQAYSAVDRFGKKSLEVAKKSLSAYSRLIPGINALRKSLSGANSEQRKLSRETDKSTKANRGLNTSFKGLIKSILAYGLGIRSIYVLFNKLRKAVTDGMGSMAKQISMVNMQMSSVVTSMNQMKAGITAAVQPLLNALAPALERVAAAIAEIAYQVASFIAAFTGQSVVYKAARVWTDYAASLDKTGKSAKKAKKELAGFDELNVLHTDDKSGADDFGGMSWDPVAPSKKAQELAERIKEIFKKLYAPIKAAWDKISRYVVKSWKYAIDKMKALGESMARDFWRVWEEEDTQAIFEDVFRIFGDIGRIIGNLAKNFKTAWDEAENGYRILASIRDVIGIIVHGISQCTFYTIKWADELTFIPLLTALADNMEQKLVPAVQKVVDLFTYLYENILSKIAKDFIEKGLPQAINVAGNLVTAIGNMAENLKNALSDGGRGVNIIENAESLLQIIADKIEYCSEKTAEWASHINFVPLLESANNFLVQSKPLVDAISTALSDLWNNTLLPFWQYLIEEGFPKLLDALAEITGGDWSKFSENAKKLTEALEPFFELAWETLVQILKDIGLALKDFLNSDELGDMIDKFKDWTANADPEDLAHKIEGLVKAFIALKAALALMSKVILPVTSGFMTIGNVFVQNNMNANIAKIAGDIAKLNGEATVTASGGISSLASKFTGLIQNLDLVNPKLLSITSTIGGLLMVVTGGAISISNFSDMMVNGFSAGSEAAMLLGIAITAVGAVILGAPALVAGVVAAIVAVVANFVIAIQTMPEELANMFNKFGEFMGSIPERFETFFSEALEKVKEFGHNLGVKVGEFIAQAPSKFKEWRDNLLVFIQNVDWLELGINIVKGILYIFSLPQRLMQFINDAINSFIDSFISGIKEGFDMHSSSKKMEPYGVMILEGILQGVISVISTIGQWIVGKLVTPIVEGIKSAFTAVTGAIKTVGSNLIQGLLDGIISKISSVISRISSFVQNIKNTFSSGLSASSLLNIGYNLLVGLVNGIINGFNMAYEKVRNGCNNIINIAKSIFDINSPSKVFEDIGHRDMEGLSNGIEDGADDANSVMESAMKDLIPDTSDNFADNFLDTLTTMKQDAISIINSMIDEMSTSMGNLDSIFSTGNWGMASQLGKLSTISIPSIAQGKTLPSTAQFSQATNGEEFDYNRLANVLSSAIVDAIGTSSYNNTNSGDTIISIDGREIFRAVKAQNEIYKKSTGKTAF